MKLAFLAVVVLLGIGYLCFRIIRVRRRAALKAAYQALRLEQDRIWHQTLGDGVKRSREG